MQIVVYVLTWYANDDNATRLIVKVHTGFGAINIISTDIHSIQKEYETHGEFLQIIPAGEETKSSEQASRSAPGESGGMVCR